MATAHAGSNGAGSAASVTSISAVMPGATGDVAIAIATNERGTVPTFTGITGWNDILAVADGTNMSCRIGWKILSGGEAGTNLNATWGSGRRASVGATAISGGNNVTAQVSSTTTATAQAGGVTTVTTPSITPPVNDCLLVAIVCAVKQTSPFTFDGTVTAPWTERLDVCSTAASTSNAAVYVATKQLTGQAGISQAGPTVTQNTNALLFAATLCIEPGAANAAPTAGAGSDQTGIQAYATVTVTGSDSDSDGTVVTRTWRVISTTNSAPTPTLNGSGNSRTFEAPGTLIGTTVTLGYKVTDNLGLDSAEDTMTVDVLPATERAVIGGVEVPMKVQAVLNP